MSTEEKSRSAKPPAQSRIQQACQRCRTLKARCLPSTDQGICQRCANSKRDCIWPESQQRTRLPRGPSRISQVEKKIDGLVARITSSYNSHDQLPNTPQSSATRLSSSTTQDTDYVPPDAGTEQYTEHEADEVEQAARSLESLAELHNFDSGPSDAESNEDATNFETSSTDNILGQSLLGNPVSDGLLDQYRPMSGSFPFVPIEEKMTVQELCRRKPMVLLAIMAVASWKDRKLQATLEKQYRRELAYRTVVQPRKTVTLLQSMLIYLAWYNYFLDPKFESFSMLQLAVGLAIDLKLEPRFIPQLLPERDPNKRVRGGKDGQRALLGCYYLCSMAACALQTPVIFRFSNHMSMCRQKLEEEKLIASDTLLSLMVDAQHLDDQICDILYPVGFPASYPTKELVLAQLNVWQKCIDGWKKLIDGQENQWLLRSTIHDLEMKLYHSVFRHLRKGSCTSLLRSYGTSMSSILSSCIEGGRSFLDTLVSIPTEDFHLVPFSVWARLPRVLINMAMLTSPSKHHLPEWKHEVARDRVRLDLFLDSLCFRMQSRTTFNPPVQPSPDFWSAMNTILQSIGRWYKRMNREVAKLPPEGQDLDDLAQMNSWDPEANGSGLRSSNDMYAYSGSASTFASTPESANSIAHTQSNGTAMFQPIFSGMMCPMMNTNPNFDLDQFMDIGFWGDGSQDFNLSNFNY